MIENTLNICKAGEYKIGGYAKEMIDYTINNQLLDEETWKLFVNQFRLKKEHTEIEWRGEFWGKMMRGGALTYIATKNEKLYKVLTNTVLDLLSTQDKLGRISTFNVDCEFIGWDMWARKYVMLGLLYYMDICKSEALKKKIVKALIKHADYIVKKIGDGKNQKSIYKTSSFWGALNSCSIIEPFVKLYGITKDKKYSDFVEYIINTGCCTDFNLIESCRTKNLYPYQFKFTKAYEMMSCLEGVLEYYKYTKNEDYIFVVKNFVDMVLQSDYSIIGCSGCLHELFDNSSKTQTEPAKEFVMQETCVTVTFMKLCAKLLVVTGDEKYAEVIEKSGYNALFGAVNNQNQDMHRSEGIDYNENGPFLVPHEPFPFDSYSPLYLDRRGKRVGGFRPMEDGRSYGCCACIGSAGTAIFGLFGIMKNKEGLVFNLYNDGRFNGEIKGKSAKVVVRANPYKKNSAKITIDGNNNNFSIKLRVPSWAENFNVKLNGKEIKERVENGYITIKKTFNKDIIEIKFDAPIKMHLLNNKVAFTRGAITLARDIRFNDKIDKPISLKVKDNKNVRGKIILNDKFYSNLTVKIPTKNGDIILCDYSEAGKNYDQDNSLISVWQDIEK